MQKFAKETMHVVVVQSYTR